MALSDVLSSHEQVAPKTTIAGDAERTTGRDARPQLERAGFTADYDELPPGYFYSKFFLRMFAALAIGLFCGCASFAYAPPVLGILNACIGPDGPFPWIAYVCNLAIVVTFSVGGRLSEIFGRHYYFIGGAALRMIGVIVCSRAQSVPVLIGGNTSLGIASATQLSYHFGLDELAPTRYRYHVVAVLCRRSGIRLWTINC